MEPHRGSPTSLGGEVIMMDVMMMIVMIFSSKKSHSILQKSNEHPLIISERCGSNKKMTLCLPNVRTWQTIKMRISHKQVGHSFEHPQKINVSAKIVEYSQFFRFNTSRLPIFHHLFPRDQSCKEIHFLNIFLTFALLADLCPAWSRTGGKVGGFHYNLFINMISIFIAHLFIITTRSTYPALPNCQPRV